MSDFKSHFEIGINDEQTTEVEPTLDGRQPCWKRRRFHIITGISVLLTLVSLCVVIPIVAVRSNNVEYTDDIVYGSFWYPLGDKLLASKGGIEFGESMDLSGDGVFLAIGSNNKDNARGKVEVKKYTGRVWRQAGNTIEGAFKGENFGNAVQLSQDGNILVASGTGSDFLTGKNKGHVRSYQLDESNQQWIQFGRNIEGLVAGDRFGISLSMASDGKSFVVGSDNFWVDDQRNGYARVYEFINGDWREKGLTVLGMNESRTGYATSMSGDGNTICVGEIWWKDSEDVQRGRARCFKWSKDKWVRKGGDIIGNVESGQMGYSLFLSHDGNRVAAGDRYGGESDQGSVSVFQMNGNNWSMMGTEQISSEEGDQGGFKVTLNARGDVLAWIARGHDNDESNNVGIVRVAHWAESEWKQLGEDLMGDTAGDFFGESVTLSDGGTIIAASSNLNTVEYSRVYTLI